MFNLLSLLLHIAVCGIRRERFEDAQIVENLKCSVPVSQILRVGDDIRHFTCRERI